MSTFKSNMMIIMTLMLASMQFYNTMAQTTHTVGGGVGWTVPPNGPSTYATWASGQTFTVGDVLIFNFTSGAHTVAEVSQAAYGPCATANPISVTATGPARLALNAPGTHYYICTVGSHCQIGQKLTINVRPATSDTPASAPAPATSAPVASPTTAPTLSPTMAPTPSTTVTPPASSPSPSQSEVSPPTPQTTGQSPSGSTTPSPTDSTTLPPPSPSGVGSSYAVAVPFTFLAAALAFFY